jgi:uncharacterized protein (DUF488 family)
MSAGGLLMHTIGHGRQPFAEFLALLKENEVGLVCDVRSAARSRWPQYNGRVLSALLGENGVGYEWLPECGGKVVVAREELERGLDRIVELASAERIALMCSESWPLTKHVKPRANCHRVGLLGPPLKARGARLLHILPGGGTLEIDEAAVPSVW